MVTIQLDAAQQSRVKVGDAVTITLPQTTETTPGTVTVGGHSCHGADRAAAARPRGCPRHPDRPGSHRQPRPGPGGGRHHHGQRRSALVVPVDALLALSRRRLRRRGGWAPAGRIIWCRSPWALRRRRRPGSGQRCRACRPASTWWCRHHDPPSHRRVEVAEH